MKAIEYLAEAAQAVEDGNKDALELLVELKRLENELKLVKEQISQAAEEELYNYPKAKAEAFGATIELRKSAGRWSFKEIDAYNETKAALKAIEDQAKDAYKASVKGQHLYDENGVEVTPASFTEGKDTFVITLAK